MAPSRHDWKIVDWDVKPQHNQLRQIYGMCDIVSYEEANNCISLKGLSRL